jgi:hypothetical protein
MGTRGRPSIASLIVPDSPTEIIQRPDAPYDLTDEQAEEWRAIVGTMDLGHFMRGNYPLLAQLCRHIVNARRIAQLIEQCVKEEEFDRKEYGILLQLEATESAAIMRLSCSMRLTQQQAVKRSETTKHPTARTKNSWDREK